jgi:dTDP-4-amino-4,6-dideoxygalactose transaminase
MYRRAKLLRWYGLDRTQSDSFRCAQNISEVGYKYHMNDIAATIGLANLECAKFAVKTHQRNAEQLHAALTGTEGISLPPFSPYCHYWLFPVLVEGGYQWDFIRYLARCGVESSPVHGRNDQHAAFNFPNGPLPGVDAFCSREVCIPVGWWLDAVTISKVINAVRGWPEYLANTNLCDVSSEG